MACTRTTSAGRPAASHCAATWRRWRALSAVMALGVDGSAASHRIRLEGEGAPLVDGEVDAAHAVKLGVQVQGNWLSSASERSWRARLSEAELAWQQPRGRPALLRLEQLVSRHAEALISAIDADFGGRSRTETELLEMLPTLRALRHARAHRADTKCGKIAG